MRYSTEQTFTYPYEEGEIVLTVKTNGGSLVVSTFDGVEFVPEPAITTDGAIAIFASGAGIRYTPSGGCTFSVKGE